MVTKIYSKAYNREFEVEVCPSADGELYNVISHKSLQNLFDIELRGQYESSFEVIKDNPGHCITKCVIKELTTGFVIEEIGEKSKVKGEGEIAQQFPVTSAYTRAFDRAMIRMLGFEGKFYSDEELGTKIAPESPVVTGVPEVPQDIFKDDEYEDDTPVGDATVELNAPDYEALANEATEDEVETSVEENESPAEDEPVEETPTDDEPVEDSPAVDEPAVDEPAVETSANSAEQPEPVKKAEDDPGEYRMTGGTRMGQSIREIYNDGNGKGWLDYYLGGPKAKMEVKRQIVRFYLANGIKGPDGTCKEGLSKLQKEIYLNAKVVYDQLVAEIKKEG